MNKHLKCFLKVIGSIPLMALVFMMVIPMLFVGIFMTGVMLPFLLSGCFDEVSDTYIPLFWGFDFVSWVFNWWSEL